VCLKDAGEARLAHPMGFVDLSALARSRSASAGHSVHTLAGCFGPLIAAPAGDGGGNGQNARSKRTGKPCRAAAMPNGRCKVHGGKSTGPRTPEGLERSRRANWKHGHFSREAKAERSRVRAAILALRYLRNSI
jgi:hypothetical protein